MEFQTATSEIAQLKAEIEKLKLTQASSSSQPQLPTQDQLILLTKQNVETFATLPSLQQWMRTFTETFARSVDSTNPTSTADTVSQLWANMVTTYFHYNQKYATQKHSFRPHRTTPLNLTYNQAMEQGGRLSMEQTQKGVCTFIILNDKRFYVAQHSGRIYDTSQPPPQACDRCGAMHWHWECSS